MNRFKYSQEVYHIPTEKMTRIKSVITNHGNKSSVYILDNGMTVGEGELLGTAPIKKKPTKRVNIKRADSKELGFESKLKED